MILINNYILIRMTKMKESIEILSERLMLMYINYIKLMGVSVTNLANSSCLNRCNVAQDISLEVL